MSFWHNFHSFGIVPQWFSRSVLVMILRVLMQRRSLVYRRSQPVSLDLAASTTEIPPVIYTIRSEGHALYDEGLTNQIYCLTVLLAQAISKHARPSKI